MNDTSLKERLASRKFILMFMILTFSTLILILPSVLSVISTAKLESLMSGGEFVSLIIGTYGLYVGGNVMEKKVLGSLTNDDSSAQPPTPKA